VDPSETRKGKQPKEQHEISDSAADLRSLVLGDGFLFVVRRFRHEHRSRQRSGRIGNLRWKSGGERRCRCGRGERHRRASHGRAARDWWCSGNGRRRDRWVNADNNGRFSDWRFNVGSRRFSDWRDNLGNGWCSDRWVHCGNGRFSHRRVKAGNGRFSDGRIYAGSGRFFEQRGHVGNSRSHCNDGWRGR
jgi:hypothetical protein